MSSVAPSIINSGLLLVVDIASLKCYPATGAVLTTLTNKVSSGSLVNGPTYSPSNGGVITLDGTDDYILLNSVGLGNFINITHSTWFYPTGAGIIIDELGQNALVGGWHDSQIEVSSGGVFSFGIWTGSGRSGIITSTKTLNNWYNLVITYNGTTMTAYVNGVNVGNVTTVRGAPPDLFYAVGPQDSTNMGNNLYATGKFSNFLVYNRALSAMEINDNFNAMKGRYGL